jgi:hypothetical protein
MLRSQASGLSAGEFTQTHQTMRSVFSTDNLTPEEQSQARTIEREIRQGRPTVDSGGLPDILNSVANQMFSKSFDDATPIEQRAIVEYAKGTEEGSRAYRRYERTHGSAARLQLEDIEEEGYRHQVQGEEMISNSLQLADEVLSDVEREFMDDPNTASLGWSGSPSNIRGHIESALQTGEFASREELREGMTWSPSGLTRSRETQTRVRDALIDSLPDEVFEGITTGFAHTSTALGIRRTQTSLNRLEQSLAGVPTDIREQIMSGFRDTQRRGGFHGAVVNLARLSRSDVESLHEAAEGLMESEQYDELLQLSESIQGNIISQDQLSTLHSRGRSREARDLMMAGLGDDPMKNVQYLLKQASAGDALRVEIVDRK